MTKKEIKKIAKELAALEYQAQHSEGELRYQTEKAIMTLTNKVTDIEDMVLIDDMVMKILEQKS